MLTKKIEYGYIILKKLNESSQEKLMSGKEILESNEIPYRVGLSILTQLSKSGIVNSAKGKKGGFYLKKREVTMLELFLALERTSLDEEIKRSYIDLNYQEITVRIGSCLLKELKKIKIIPLTE